MTNSGFEMLGKARLLLFFFNARVNFACYFDQRIIFTVEYLLSPVFFFRSLKNPMDILDIF